MAHAPAQALRAVLRDIEVGEPLAEVPRRSLAELRGEVAAVNTASAACDYGILGQTVPDLVGALSTLAEINGGTEVRLLLADVLHAAFYLSEDLGHSDLAWMVSGHLHAITVALGEPVLGAVAGFVRYPDPSPDGIRQATLRRRRVQHQPRPGRNVGQPSVGVGLSGRMQAIRAVRDLTIAIVRAQGRRQARSAQQRIAQRHVRAVPVALGDPTVGR